jgi:hypothetical protein
VARARSRRPSSIGRKVGIGERGNIESGKGREGRPKGGRVEIGFPGPGEAGEGIWLDGMHDSPRLARRGHKITPASAGRGFPGKAEQSVGLGCRDGENYKKAIRRGLPREWLFACLNVGHQLEIESELFDVELILDRRRRA